MRDRGVTITKTAAGITVDNNCFEVVQVVWREDGEWLYTNSSALEYDFSPKPTAAATNLSVVRFPKPYPSWTYSKKQLLAAVFSAWNFVKEMEY